MEEKFLHCLAENTKSFWVGSGNNIQILEHPNDFQFMKAVSKYTPVILRGVLDNWSILKDEFPLDSLQSLSPTHVQVNFTRYGNADSVESVSHPDNEVFVYPAEVTLSFDSFREMLENKQPEDAVPYLSQQNDNLRQCFPELVKAIAPSIALADSAFGIDKLEAVNLWVGDERSVTSLHKDYYENMYAVVMGEKVFHLFPPSDSVFMHESSYSTRRYELKSGETAHTESRHLRKDDLILNDSEDSPTISWIAYDPTDSDSQKRFPLTKYASCIECKVSAGEMLYIPAMWYHRVSQSCTTIAVNYWYDMEFDFR